MADEYQIQYEYTNGNTIDMKTNDLKIGVRRQFMTITTRPDGKMYVDDPTKIQRTFSGTCILSGADMNTLHDVQIAAITYSGGYPRIQKIYWNGATTETNIEVAMTKCEGTDMGAGWWHLAFEFTEKTD
jgi:hypothetical protein